MYLQASRLAKRYPLITEVGWMFCCMMLFALFNNSAAMITTDVVPSPTLFLFYCLWWGEWGGRGEGEGRGGKRRLEFRNNKREKKEKKKERKKERKKKRTLLPKKKKKIKTLYPANEPTEPNTSQQGVQPPTFAK